MPPPMMAISTPPSTRPENASRIPPTTMANSTKPVTKVPVEIVCALAPSAENGSWAKTRYSDKQEYERNSHRPRALRIAN